MSQARQADATGHVEIHAAPDRVYELVSDPGALAELANEYTTFRWLNGYDSAEPGARFKGSNKHGWRRWSTVSTVTDADPPRRFAFEVTVELGPLSITGARWQYDIEPTDYGCVVTESTWDKRAGWAKKIGNVAAGVGDRAEHNRHNIAATLRRLKAHTEEGTS